ncbi:MAG: hypothetical protein KUA29_04390 [Methanobacterium sp.]|nr:hypothetical protein [Methanobacterium sp.]MBV1767521.1 hypothetical protein [Methanobacterium sp.]
MMAVLEPLKVVITNWPEDKTELLELENMPGDESAGTVRFPLGGRFALSKKTSWRNHPRNFTGLLQAKKCG